MPPHASETPMGLALVVCDTIIEDKFTGKKSLIGLFDRIHAGSFPCLHSALSVFVALTNVKGEMPCEIVCRHVESDSVIWDAKGRINCPDPSRVVELVFHFKGVRFPQPGTYWLHFLADESLIMMRPLFVNPLKAEGEGHKPETPA